MNCDVVSASDVNECLRNNGGCDVDAACLNTPGSFRCVCDEGFEGDGYRCKGMSDSRVILLVHFRFVV